MNSYQLMLDKKAALKNPPVLYADHASPGYQSLAPAYNTTFDGDKFAGGFGATQLFEADYWTLRARSAQLFNDNLYARGLIRRLITNVIGPGLMPEATPNEEVLGVTEDSLNDWSELTESRFAMWADNPKICDYNGALTFGQLQAVAKQEALVDGDVLVVLLNSQRTRMPQVKLIQGSKVRTPFGVNDAAVGKNEIVEGVEYDPSGRQVAFHVVQNDGKSKRLPAYGEKSKRRLAWLIYGTDKRMHQGRGQPLLSLVLQSLKEIDRYRDSAQRKAVINSILAMFVKKTEDKPGSLPMTGGAVRKGSATVTDPDGSERQFNIANQVPGLVMEELQVGEEPVGFNSAGTDLNFGVFETAILQSVAWANETPPEILTMSFSSNYSASQAAINEFKMYINREWINWGSDFAGPIYQDFLISETLLGRTQAPGFIDAWRNMSAQYDTYGAWVSSVWYGSIKPSSDMSKAAKASEKLIELGLSTRAREARINTGTKFSQNAKRLRRENEQLAAARRPLMELDAEFGTVETTQTEAAADSGMEALKEYIEDNFEHVG